MRVSPTYCSCSQYRRIHVGLVCADTRGPPADLPDFAEHGIAARESAALLEGVGREQCADVVDCQCLVGRLDRNLDIAERAPPQGPEQTAAAPVRDEAVAQASHGLALDFVAIALLAFRAARRLRSRGLGVGERDRRAPAASRHELGIRRGQVPSVEQERHGAAWRHRPRPLPLHYGGWRVTAVHTRNSCEALGRFLHRRDCPGYEHPARRGVADPSRSSDRELGYGGPGRIRELHRLPSPGILVPVDLLARAAHEILVEDRCAVDQQERHGIVPHRLPRAIRVDQPLSGCIALHQQPGFVSHLRHRRLFGEVPDHDGDDVAAGPERGCDVLRLESPVVQVSSCGARHQAPSIHVQLVTVVRGRMDHESRRHRCEIESLPEVVNAETPGRRVGRSYPVRIPACRQQTGGGGLSVSGTARRENQNAGGHGSHHTHAASRSRAAPAGIRAVNTASAAG